MLTKIYIKNIALIEEQAIEFYDGFSVLTGETGAGKSIIIESFNFVLGERASKDFIKYGAEKASVEAEFEIKKTDSVYDVLKSLEMIPEDDTIILYRELNTAGKNVCRVNGIPVSTTVLKQIGDGLVDIHGQHSHQSLLNTKMHINILDSFAGQDSVKILNNLEIAYKNFQNAKRALNDSVMNECERAQKCDLYAYQIKEIDDAKLKNEEEEELVEQRDKLAHAQTIMDSLGFSSETLSGENGIMSQLASVQRYMESISGFSSEYKESSDKVNDSYYALEDVAYAIRNLKDGFIYDPDELNKTEWRLEQISQLKRKYGNTISEILAYRDKIEEEYSILQNIEERKELLQLEYDKYLKEYNALADQISQIRKQTSEKLSEKLLSELSDLGMPNASFEVQIEKLEGDAQTSRGYDSVEFLLSANKGEPAKPLAHVASGGELSRIMLGFKTVLAQTDGIPTMVFDEIDTGVSGQIGIAIARKMRQIAKRHQVLCITHLAQIAAYANNNYLVEKETVGERTVSHAVKLNEEERIHEIARIMGGDGNDAAAVAHAKTLVDTAEQEIERSF